MASVFLYHVVGDLTVGKPELVEFHETETVEAAIGAIGESAEGSIAVWKKRSHSHLPINMVESSEARQQRFVGILNSLDIVAFLARTHSHSSPEERDKALATPVAHLLLPNNSLLRLVDPATRFSDPPLHFFFPIILLFYSIISYHCMHLNPPPLFLTFILLPMTTLFEKQLFL